MIEGLRKTVKANSLKISRAGLLFLGLLLVTCGSGTVRVDNIKYRTVDLPEYGIKLVIPDFWEKTPGSHFQFIASGNGPNKLPATIEYRGQQSGMKDDTGKALYAVGWYGAIQRNYDQKTDDAKFRDWKYKYKRKVSGDAEGQFEFEGTYRAGAIVYRKIGKLRFRGDRAHAIYYTAPDQDFRPVRRLFETIDAMHEFYPPTAQEGEDSDEKETEP